jgi:hypothetical protein
MIFETTENQIAALDHNQLTELLGRLLLHEARLHDISPSAVSISTNILAKDGGLDASIRWEGGKSSTNYLPSRFVGFQCKATEMSPGQYADEISVDAPKKATSAPRSIARKTKKKKARKSQKVAMGSVKPQIEPLFRSLGNYIVFTTAKLNESAIERRIKAIRERLQALGKNYFKTAKISIYPASTIRSWVNSHLAAIVFVQRATGFPVVPGLKTWSEWESVFPPHSPYYPDSQTMGIKDSVRAALSTPRSSIRLLGLSGLGKTRLALEALRPTSAADELSEQVVYFDAAHDPRALTGEVSEWRRAKIRGVLVVDNCPSGLHLQLQAEVQAADSQLSLLTLELDPSEQLHEVTAFKLVPSTGPHIEYVVGQLSPQIPPEGVSKIVELSGGFVFFARLLCASWSASTTLEHALPDSRQVLRMLWGSSLGDDAYRAIQACALVESADLDIDLSDETKYLANLAGISPQALRTQLMRFVDRGLIESYGKYVRVRPYPLALRLCADWWRTCPPGSAASLFETIPESMVDPLCNRLRVLDFLPAARELAGRLCGPQGPFGQAEVLSSARGARIFRALVELNPEACVSTLHLYLSGLDSQQLQALSSPRRDWVWALEKLVFHNEIYTRAADCLVRLSVDETENYSNNATGTFRQTFHVFLPGTEASLAARERYLRQLFTSKDPELIPVALKAADSALTTEHFMRMTGAESQGGGPPLFEYKPSPTEIRDYWEGVVQILFDAHEDGSVPASEVLQILGNHIRGFARIGHLDLIDKILAQARELAEGVWETGLSQLGEIARYEAPGWPTNQRERLESWIESLRPQSTDLRSRLILAVSKPSWSDFLDDVANRPGSNAADVAAHELALECANNLSTWLPYLSVVFVGEQRSGSAFGFRLGELLRESNTFLNLALSTLRKERDSGGNPVVLLSFLDAKRTSDPALVTRTINEFLSDRTLVVYAPYVLAGLKPSIEVLLRLVACVKANLLTSPSLKLFAYGRALEHLPPSDAVSFAMEVRRLDQDSPWIALELLFMYCHGEKKVLWPEIRYAVREIHMSGSLKLSKQRRNFASHIWEATAIKLLQEPDDDLARSIASQLVESCISGVSVFELSSKVGICLLDKFGNQTWPIFANALVNSSPKDAWSLSRYLGRGLRSSGEDEGGPIDALDNRILSTWLADHPEAASIVAAVIRPIVSTGEEFDWTPMAKHLINQYGNRKGVLSGLGGSLIEGTWVGSRSPHYRKLIRLSNRLLNHPKPHVRAWAARVSRDMESWLERESNQEHARKVGRW